MNYSTKVISLLICALLASSINAQEQSDSDAIKIRLFKGSNANWIAFNVQDAGVGMTTAVQMHDSAEGSSWADMKHVDGWAHWVLESANDIVFPVSIRLTSKAEQVITLENIIADLEEKSIDTGAQWTVPRMSTRGRKGSGKNRPNTPTTAAPSETTEAPTTTKAASTKGATKSPTTTKAASTNGATTKAPTVTTKAPTVTTKAPTVTTKAPTVTTKAPTVTTKAPTVVTPKPSTGSSGQMKVMVPLYMYPGAAWNTVAASGAVVPTVAIINPNSGPGSGPDSSYKTYMAKMQSSGVDMIGYVHTSYGARSISDVKADIAKYASEFPQVVGIFIDEAAATAAQVSYYTQVYNYIMSMPGYKYCVLNPGAVPTQAYYAISTQIVSYENTVGGFAGSSNPSYANAANKDHFSVISYGASQSQMQTAASAAKSKGYYGWVYFTDNSGASTYNTLPSYYSAMASYVASMN